MKNVCYGRIIETELIRVKIQNSMHKKKMPMTQGKGWRASFLVKSFETLSFSAFVRTDIIEGIWDTTVITVTDGLSKDESLFTYHMWYMLQMFKIRSMRLVKATKSLYEWHFKPSRWRLHWNLSTESISKLLFRSIICAWTSNK